MYWPVLAAIALAVGYYQVGAMSVWVTVPSVTLKTIPLVVAVAALAVVGIPVRRGFGGDRT